MSSERLQKFMARAGVASRRRSEDYITEGRVRVNGEVCSELGTRVDPVNDVIEVDGVRISLPSTNVTLVLNKPKGYLTTMSDDFGRHCVSELVPIEEHGSLFPVGRLDQDTTGALLFTTDGELGHDLCHPSKHVPKRYVAQVEGRITERELDALRAGVLLEDGMTSPAVCEILKVKSDGPDPYSIVAIEITEGRKHQVKRMFDATGHKVRELHRERFGTVTADDLAPGEWRILGENEVELLTMAADMQ